MPLAGQPVQTSGVYAALHSTHQNEDGREWIFAMGDNFPGCSECGFGVQYTLVYAAPSFTEFAGLETEIERESAA